MRATFVDIHVVGCAKPVEIAMQLVDDALGGDSRNRSHEYSITRAQTFVKHLFGVLWENK
jgi:hypothetical protein